ncbi:hypothetical protein ACE6ED_22360, partial [Paenibacillus sp. CN-4]|uniref:hypothetical protein n=1 Tax=Paenibacillus nanchangensis TaxID=3348343 RepID=UPI0039791282
MITLKAKKSLYIIVFLLLSALFLLFYLLSQAHGNKEKIVISIGVPESGNTAYNYSQFKSELENKFDISINLVELYPASENGTLTEQMIIDNTYKKVKNGEVDLIIGLTPNKIAPLVEDDLLLDITDKIENKDSLHKGVLKSSIKGGHGKIYYISPVIKTMYFVLQNDKIFKDLGVDLLPTYPTYKEFLNTLKQLNASSKAHKVPYSPIAFAVKNTNEEELFIGDQFRMFGYNLETPYYSKGQLMNDEWRE